MSGRVINIDMTIAKISHQQVACHGAERGWSDSQSPRSIQCTARSNPSQKIAIQAELIDIPQSRPRDLVVPGAILHRISDIQRTIEILDIEGRVSAGKAGVGKRAG